MASITKVDKLRIATALNSELIAFVNDGVTAGDGARITVTSNKLQHPRVDKSWARSALESRALERITTIRQIYGSSGGTKLGPRPKLRDYVSK